MSIQGTITYPGDERYDELRTPWLRVFDQRPALIVEATSSQDVAASVRLAREKRLALGIMTTGHGIAAACDGGLLLRLTKLKRIDIDAEGRTARVDPGVLAGELSQALAARRLAFPIGQVSNVGVAGFTLGGGMGWLVRKLGIAADRIVAADVVLADGSLVRASRENDADLLWALRGGGGNFGIVTSLEVELSALDGVVGGERYYAMERANAVARFYRTWSSQLSNETSTILRFVSVPPDDSLPAAIRGKTCCMIGLCHASPNTADDVLRSLDEIGTPLVDSVRPCTLADMESLDPASHTSGAPAYGHVEFLKALTDEIIDTLVDRANSMIPPLMQFEVQQLGGALRERAPGTGAFHASQAPYLLHLESVPNEVPMSEIARKTHEVFDALGDAYTGEKYYNFLRGDEQPIVARAFASRDFARLRELKQKYDPDNFFHLNANVEPAV
ncbi:MAG TPA: FAD-binding oxidoreductase [Candidatus Tumulicola sp.]|jgi:FAD/FMN-containing dehydrogenase